MPVIERVTEEEAVARTRAALGDLASEVKGNLGHVDVTCTPDRLVEVMTQLRDSEGLECRYFTFLSAVDYSEYADDPGGLQVLVHVYAPERALHATVHVPLEEPRCPSITSVYRGAMWHERECWEMFGIEFEGHPHLVKLYLPEDFEGNPLLKSFKLPSRALVKEWPGAKDPDEAAAGGR